jgi:hypothetical protein
MSIEECEVPASSVLERRLVEAAYFRDAYAFYIVPITCPTAYRLGQLTRVSVSYSAN